MTFFDQSKSIVENLNYLSGPIIALLGLVAILQLRLSKKIMIMTSKRQAAEIATEQIKIYVEKIITLQNEIFTSKEEKKYQNITVKNIENFTFEELKANTSLENILIKQSEYIEYAVQIADLLNLMESFAIYFTKGIADEEIAFSSIGSTYCFSIRNLTFELCFIRLEDDLDSYQNIVKLYQIWNPKIVSNKITRELNKKQQELKNLQINTVDILGTK